MSATKEWERRRGKGVRAAEFALRHLDRMRDPEAGARGGRESISTVLKWIVSGELVPAKVKNSRCADLDRDADLWLRWLELRVVIGVEEAAKPENQRMPTKKIELAARRRLEDETGLSATTVRRAVRRGLVGTN